MTEAPDARTHARMHATRLYALAAALTERFPNSELVERLRLAALREVLRARQP
jgi:hypothetical protein